MPTVVGNENPHFLTPLDWQMEYIVVFNSTTREPILMTDDRGFIETFSSEEKAREFAKDQLDGNAYRDFEVYETVRNG